MTIRSAFADVSTLIVDAMVPFVFALLAVFAIVACGYGLWAGINWVRRRIFN